MEINGRGIGPGFPCYLVAEISANHNQSLDKAMALIRAAGDAGADAVKLQTYRADTITLDCDSDVFRIDEGTAWAGRRLYELYEEAHTPWEWHEQLFAAAKAEGLHCFSSPFDHSAVELLENLDAPAYKIASFELVDHGLISRCAKTGKPLIMSTGMASIADIEEAVAVARKAGCEQLVLLRCVSAYPAPAAEMSLANIVDMRTRFDCITGLSDHTLGTNIATVAVALGAAMIEKHFTLQRSDGGPDAHFSLEPAEFAQMVQAVREAESAIGAVDYNISSSQQASLAFRRSLFAVQNIARGECFSNENIRSIRPADGLAPKHLPDVLGKTAAKDIKLGTPLSWDLIS